MPAKPLPDFNENAIVHPNFSSLPRRDGRVAEGAPLLREYGVNSSIEGSNPSLSASMFFTTTILFLLLKTIFNTLRYHPHKITPHPFTTAVQFASMRFLSRVKRP